MEIVKFGLGVRFDVMEGEEEQATPKQLWEEIFSVLTASEAKGLHVYGGMASSAEFASDQPCYICVFNNGRLSQMRRVFRKLEEDAGISMYLAATHPFLQSNALKKVDGLTYYGRIQRDGTLHGGDADLFGIRVCKKRGKRRPIGKGIVFLLAPDAFGGALTSKQAIRRLTLAARRHFTGVRIMPLPIAKGGEGTVDAILTASNGTARTVQIQGPTGGKLQARYAVLRGSTALIEMPGAFSVQEGLDGSCSSFGIGELIRRALDEGLREIIIGLSDSCINDFGLGCLRALGIKLLDSQGNELSTTPDDESKIDRIDTELMHPRVGETRFILMTDSSQPLDARGNHYAYLLNQAAGFDACSRPGAMAAGGLGAALIGLLGSECMQSIDALLYAVEFERRVKNVSLVVTGEGRLDESSISSGRTVGAILDRCSKQKTPVALIAGCLGKGGETLLEQCECSIIAVSDEPMTREEVREKATAMFDSAANRMFRFIRLGREIERVSMRKSKK